MTFFFIVASNHKRQARLLSVVSMTAPTRSVFPECILRKVSLGLYLYVYKKVSVCVSYSANWISGAKSTRVYMV